MGILNPQSLEQHEQLTTLVVSTTQDCGWSGVGEFVFYLWLLQDFWEQGNPLEMTPLRFKPISILKVTNQFWQDWHARGMWWLGEQAERNSWPGYHLSPGQHRRERVLLVVNCCSVVGVWLWLAVGCALFFFLFDCLAVWLHIPFADHGAQGGTLVIAIAVISFRLFV